MKIKFVILIFMLLSSLLPISGSEIELNNDHENFFGPIFISLSDTGDPINSYIYDNQTILTINYKADRYNVEGIILLGQGSNLTENKIDLSQNRNFTKDYSLRDKSYYSIKINLTSYTYFYAYAWYGNFENGTYEEISLVGGAKFHELYINNGKWFPQSMTDREVYVPYHNNYTIKYKVKNFENDTNDFVTLSVAENSSALYEQSKSIIYDNMTRVNYTEIDGEMYSIFEFEINISLPLIYFSAFNENGWERSDGKSAIFNKIGIGFNFTTNFNEDLTMYTNIDTVKFNITTFNRTDDITDVGYKIRIHQNSSSYNETTSWTEVNGLNILEELLLNTTINERTNVNSSLKSIYNVTLKTYDIDNIIEIQSFLKYGLDSNVSSDIFSIKIIDAAPIIEIKGMNETITRAQDALVKFDFDTPKGDIVEAKVNHILPNDLLLRTYNVLNKNNVTFDFSFDENQTILQGLHVFEFNVTNSLNMSEIKIYTIKVDQEKPIGTISILSPKNSISTDGFVEIQINYEDTGIDPTGINLVKVDWGNNMTVNATGLSKLEFRYDKNGIYEITLIVYDNAGNFISLSINVEVDLIDNITSSENNNSSFNFIFFISSMFFISFFVILRRRNF